MISPSVLNFGTAIQSVQQQNNQIEETLKKVSNDKPLLINSNPRHSFTSVQRPGTQQSSDFNRTSKILGLSKQSLQHLASPQTNLLSSNVSEMRKKSFKSDRDYMQLITERIQRDQQKLDEALEKDFFRTSDLQFRESKREENYMNEVLKDYDKSRQFEKERYSSILNPIAQQVINGQRRSSNIFEIIKQKEKENKEKDQALKEGNTVGYNGDRAEKIIQLFEEKRKQKFQNNEQVQYKSKFRKELRNFVPNQIMDKLIVQNKVQDKTDYASNLLNKVSQNIEYYLKPSKRPQTQQSSQRKRMTTESEEEDSMIFTEQHQKDEMTSMQLQFIASRTKSQDTNIGIPNTPSLSLKNQAFTKEQEDTFKIYNNLKNNNTQSQGVFSRNLKDSQLNPMILNIITNGQVNSLRQLGKKVQRQHQTIATKQNKLEIKPSLLQSSPLIKGKSVNDYFFQQNSQKRLGFIIESQPATIINEQQNKIKKDRIIKHIRSLSRKNNERKFYTKKFLLKQLDLYQQLNYDEKLDKEFMSTQKISKADLMIQSHRQIPNPLFDKDNFEKTYEEKQKFVHSFGTAFELSEQASVKVGRVQTALSSFREKVQKSKEDLLTLRINYL
eukprot:403377548